MKKFIYKLLVKILAPVNRRLGFVRAKNSDVTNKDYLLNNLISLLKKIDYYPETIIDVGANHGTWSRVWKKAFPNTKFILVEPQSWLQSSFTDLLDEKTTFLPVGAGKQNGTFKFTINVDRDDSSTFSLNADEASSKGYKQIDVPVYTLNFIADQYAVTTPDIIKIDAEGIDIDVLEGASSLFGKTECFLVEASINAPFEETSIEKLIAYMDTKGYRVFDFTDLNRPFRTKVLWLVEIAFVKKGGKLDKGSWLEM